jgi:RNA polymerase sigma-70 factor (ECF subfamily)
MSLGSVATLDGIRSNNEDASSRDMALVVAARSGSNAAFEELYSLYSHRLFQRILSMTRNREDAEDALQETFLHAYVALNSFEGRSQFATWLTRIAMNSALMTLRRRRRKAEVSFDLPSELEENPVTFEVCDPAMNPEQICDRRQRYHCTLRAVHKLHPKLRTVLSIRLKQECSMDEIARSLDVPVATVKSRLHRARKQLNLKSGFKVKERRSG